ncbi:unnamed protein product [Amoebophrya sp. A120]|nr:unnamed protein product [Amoebophrya sp. A120]|eukprot:GSA120T00017744001.1
MEIATISQCVLCGSYHLFVLDTVEVHPTLTGQLKRTLHDAESEEIVKLVKRRILDRKAHDNASKANVQVQQRLPANGYTLTYYPCATCVEIKYEEAFAVVEQREEFLKNPMPLTPHIPVLFENCDFSTGGDREVDDKNGENYNIKNHYCARTIPITPAYRNINGKWTLREGIGPKVLDTYKTGSPWRLPAAQFKVLLPGFVASTAEGHQSAAGACQQQNKGKDSCKKSNTNSSGRAAAPGASTSSSDRQEFLRLLWNEEVDASSLLTVQRLIDDDCIVDDGEKIYVKKPVFCDPTVLTEYATGLSELMT